MRFSPVGALYADVGGDDVPDLSIGRLPLRSEGELGVWLSKSAAGELGDYDNTAVFAADAYDADQGYSFTADSDNQNDPDRA